MTVMWNVELDGSGQPIAHKKVLLLLLADGNPAYGDSFSVESVGEVVTDEDGRWTAELVPNSTLSPSGTVYRAQLKFRGGTYEHNFIAPDAEGEQWVGANLADEPGALPTTALLQHIALTTGAHGGLVSAADPRLTNARTPTGPAGGVLSGTWPNPGFAQDMATQVELNSAVAGLASGDLVATEAAARQAADETLEDLITLEVSDRQAAVTFVQNGLTGEITRATAAENTLTVNLASEIARATASEGILTTNLAAEVTNRIAAVQGVVDDLAAEAQDRLDSEEDLAILIGIEEDARIAGDTAARARANHTGVQAISTVTGLQGSLDSLGTSIATETTERQAATAAVQAYATQRANHSGVQAINTITDLQGILDANATAAANALARANHTGVQSIATITNLQTNLDAKATVVALNGIASDLATEITNRTNGDAAAIQRANHTGTQAISTIAGLQGIIDAKADLVGGLVPLAQLPSVVISDFLGEVATEGAMLLLSGQRGDWAIRTELAAAFILIGDDPSNITNWKRLPTPADAVSSVNGRNGVVIGLAEQADLTAEVNRATGAENDEVSRATTAEAGVQAYAIQRGNHTGLQAISTINGLQNALDAKATVTSVNSLAGDLMVEIDNRTAGDAAVQANAVQRANHTGTQAIATITSLQGILDAKVNLVGGQDIEITDLNKGFILKRPDGTRVRISINDANDLVTTTL